MAYIGISGFEFSFSVGIKFAYLFYLIIPVPN